MLLAAQIRSNKSCYIVFLAPIDVQLVIEAYVISWHINYSQNINKSQARAKLSLFSSAM